MRSLFGSKPKQWDQVLAQAKFAFNGLVNRMTGKVPFQVVYGRLTKMVVDLANIPDGERVSADAEALVEMLKKTHVEMKHCIEQSNIRYKSVADQHRRHKEFYVDDLVLVYLRKERFSIGTYNTLKYKKIGLYRIVRKCGANAYQVDLLEEYDLTLIFNVSDLYPYSGDDRAKEITPRDWQKQLPKKKRE